MKTGTKYFLLFAWLTFFAMAFTSGVTFSPRFSGYIDSFNLYGLRALADASLFPGDPAAGIFLDMAARPGPGTMAFISVYRVLLRYLDLLWALKLVSFLAALASFLLVYSGLKRAELKAGAAAAAAFFYAACFLSMDSFYFGQNRAFGALLNSALIYALCARRYLLVPLLAPLHFFSYAYPAFYVCILAALLPVFKRDELRGRLASYLAACLGAAALIALPEAGAASRFLASQQEVYGYKFMASGDPAGLAALLGSFLLNLDEHSRLYAVFAVLFAGLTAWNLFAGGRKELAPLCRTLWPAPLAALLGFALLYPALPLFASRQLAFILPGCLALAAGVSAASLSGERLSQALPWAAAAVFMLLHPWLNQVGDFARFRPLYEYAETLPRGAVLAGPPDQGFFAGIPLFAARGIFYSRHLDIAGVAYGPEEADRRGRVAAEICSAGSASDAARLALANGVTHLVAGGPGCAPGADFAAAGRASGAFTLRLTEGEILVAEAARLAGLRVGKK